VGDVVPIRKGGREGPAAVNDVIEQADRKSRTPAAKRCLLPRQEACTILINSIVDSPKRGMRDVDQLCAEALARLRRLQQEASQ
jgi:hypothetical protein